MKFTLQLLPLLSLALFVQAQSPVGANCTVDADCQSRLCTVPFAGPGGVQCIGRPAPNTARCDKAFEATDCDSGYCDGGRCADRPAGTDPNAPSINRPNGQPCQGDAECASKICDTSVTDNNQRLCLAANLATATGCSVNRQCVTNYCPSSWYQCRPESERQTSKKGQDAECAADDECESGVCDDLIANDGYKKVCLMGPNLPRGLACSTDRQCFTRYCVPQGSAQNPLTCQERPSDSGGSQSSSSTSSSSGGGGGGGGGGSVTSTGPGTTPSSGTGSGGSAGSGSEIVTLTSISAGRTIVTTSTRALSPGSQATSSRASSAAGPNSELHTGLVGALLAIVAGLVM